MKRFPTLLSAGLLSIGLVATSLFVQKTIVRADDRTGGPSAIAKVEAAGNQKEKITGTVVFTSETDGVRVVAAIDGLTPGKHGFHIHEKNDLTAPDLSSAGGHWNPGNTKHGGPDSAEHHAGDLGNLVADEKGHAHYDEIIKGIHIDGKMGVIGHSVIIHAKADDLTSQPAGDSGARIAGGAIVARVNDRSEK
ncbi:MAG TPA: superoxide dismutase family protein [Tepidisphaeraceae bacterium]|jgi:Cu-Zn family superoxide dismutase|nr:superoxide dismutase family protein [Tepidisphaeraceae bacterium]